MAARLHSVLLLLLGVLSTATWAHSSRLSANLKPRFQIFTHQEIPTDVHGGHLNFEELSFTEMSTEDGSKAREIASLCQVRQPQTVRIHSTDASILPKGRRKVFKINTAT